MRKRKGLPLVVGIIVLILSVAGVAFMVFNTLENSNRNSGNSVPGHSTQGESELSEGEEYMAAWVPFTINNSPELELEGFLFERTKVESASTREAAETGDNESRIEGKILEKVPHYPFKQIPLIQADMLITSDENIIGDDASISVTYYTKASVDDAREFYRNALQGFERFQEDILESDTGKSYNMSFAVQVEGNFRMDAGVMVMEMPESTGYTCCINIHGAIRGIAKKEDKPVGYREDGVPENFPDNIVPLLELREINMAEGDSSGCYIQFFSDAPYEEAVKFYREKLSDKTDFTEDDESPGEVWMTCKAPGWDINVRIMDEGDDSYMEISCYAD